MVGFLKRVYSLDRFRHGRGASERRAQGQFLHNAGGIVSSSVEEKVFTRSQGMSTSGSGSGGALEHSHEKPKSRFSKDAGGSGPPSDMDLMKERFAKLLLGEDMSGGGIGVSSALALSNAITNLAASVFGEQWRLEPMSAERKTRWRREIDWLLSVTDHIVEFVPSKQTSKDGTAMEIMVTQQRKDLRMNIPALRKLDAMLIEYLDNFSDQNEFSYVSRDADESEKGNARRKYDKWWLPTVRVPPDGLSEALRKWIHYQKELVNQVLKAAMAINANVLMEMEIPESYIESLPKNGRASLGESLYKSITDDDFNPEEFLPSVDLSTEHKILDLKNRIEASVVIWKRKMINKDNKSSWSSAVSMEKREQFEERAEIILLILKHRFPGIPQSDLDISKIQYNTDVGQSILESYSRIIESIAFTVMSRIEDVLYADSVAQDKTTGSSRRRPSLTDSDPVKPLDPKEEIEKLNKIKVSDLMTLKDFVCWEEKTETKKEKSNSEDEGKWLKKLPHLATHKKFSYIESLGGWRSPTARH